MPIGCKDEGNDDSYLNENETYDQSIDADLHSEQHTSSFMEIVLFYRSGTESGIFNEEEMFLERNYQCSQVEIILFNVKETRSHVWAEITNSAIGHDCNDLGQIAESDRDGERKERSSFNEQKKHEITLPYNNFTHISSVGKSDLGNTGDANILLTTIEKSDADSKEVLQAGDKYLVTEDSAEKERENMYANKSYLEILLFKARETKANNSGETEIVLEKKFHCNFVEIIHDNITETRKHISKEKEVIVFKKTVDGRYEKGESLINVKIKSKVSIRSQRSIFLEDYNDKNVSFFL